MLYRSTTMEFIEIPTFPILRGREAIKSLSEFIEELEEKRGKVTEKQTETLIDLARGLISCIESEGTDKNIKERQGGSFERVKGVLLSGLQLCKAQRTRFRDKL